ncbi:hypothetical protein C8P63_11811 [Melghirimyces profundicolus]|uniref:Uncharacterized protein n=1 Tax=Melghirimyces profundicolus TaxID=1242148 RepID=A0A2T6BQ95_9BACL|nr:hypothetical protein C8P63_11811 [Melghirimyces profundicolus]
MMKSWTVCTMHGTRMPIGGFSGETPFSRTLALGTAEAGICVPKNAHPDDLRNGEPPFP